MNQVMATKAVTDEIKDVYARVLLKNHDHWSRHRYHYETLHVVVASRSNGCPVFHHPRPRMQMKSAETYIMMKSPKSLDLLTVQKWKSRVRILIEGAPGVGKTTLCLFCIDEWINDKAFGEFEIVLFLPLRQIKPHSETSVVSNFELLNEALTQIQIYEVPLRSSLFHYLIQNDGEGVLIIADGWDELNEKERRSGTLLYELLLGGFLSHASVIVTSRPLANGIPLEAIDKYIMIHGFNEEAIMNYILSDFTDDPQEGHRLVKEMESNPMLKRMCTIPLNCSIACHLYRSASLDKFHSITTATKLYKEYVLILLSDDNQCICTFDAIPLDMQKPWWDICELAFSTMKVNKLVFSQEELIVDHFHFKLLQKLECGTSTKTANCYQFLHVTLQEFLAAVYISNRLSALEQNEVYKMYGKSSHFKLVWKYFLGLSLPKSLGAIKSAILETEISTLDLCHFAIETNESDAEFSLELMKKASKRPNFITPTAYDCGVVLQVITAIRDCNDISLNASNCVLREAGLSLFTDAIGLSKMKNLVLSGNKLSDNDVIKLFSKVSQTSQHIEKLDLCNNEIGEIGVRFMTKALTKLKSLQLSYNPLGISGIRTLKSAIMSGALRDIQELELQGTMSEDRNTNDELLEFFLNCLSYHCNELQIFDISENFISSKGAVALARNLLQTALQQLHMNHTSLGNKGFEAFFKTCGSECSFESLDMKKNHINFKGIQSLVEIVSSGMLLKGGIHLDENPLGMEAVLNIGQLLSNNHCLLSELSLIECRLNENISHDASITAEHIKQQLFRMSPNNDLSQLELDCNNFAKDGVNILTGFMYLCPYLRSLSSSSCQLTSEDLNALLTKLSEEKICNTLMTWCLDDCNIDDNGVTDLINFVPSIFPNLTDIHLDGNPISPRMKSKLDKWLHDNTKKSEESNQILKVEADGSHQPQSIALLQGHMSESDVEPVTEEPPKVVQKLLVYPSSMCPLEKKKIEQLKKLQEVNIAYGADLVDESTLTAVLTNMKCQVVLIEGRSGTGKTSLVQKILHTERLHDFRAIVYCQLDHDACGQVRTLKDLSTILNTSESQLHEIEDMKSDALLIFDEFDHLIQQSEWQTTIFADILFRKKFTKSSILVVSRPSGLSSLGEVNYDHHFQLKGFANIPALKFHDHWIISLFEQHTLLLSMCEIPLLNELVIKFFEQGSSGDTITDLLMFVVTEILKREKNEGIHSDLKLLNLPNGIKHNFEKLCKLAFEKQVNHHKLTSPKEISRFLSAFSLNNSFSLNYCRNFGLVENALEDLSDPNSCSIEYLHPLIGDFLAGFYLHLQPPLDQLELICKHSSLLLCQSHYTVEFLFGLTWRKSSELDLNPTKLMFNTLIEFIAYCMDKEGSTCGLTLALCIAEAKDNDLWKKLVAKLGSDLKLELSHDDISKHKWTIASMVSSSQVKEWNIHARDFKLCDELEPYIAARLNKFQVPSMKESIIILSPRVSIEVTSKRQRDAERFTDLRNKTAQVMNRFQCQAIREILQRAFAMYAEKMRLKGDSSNPAYVSFLSCECFQKNLEKNLKFDPPLPSHFLPVNSAKTLRKLQEEHGVHLASHGGKAIELVVLLKPYLRRVTLTYKSKIHHIIMMSEALVQKTVNEGAIEEACKSGTGLTDIMENENLVVCTEEAPIASEMVRPSLPLPPSEQNLKTTTILPQVTIAGASHNLVESKRVKQQKLHDQSPKCQSGMNTSSGSGSPQIFQLQLAVSQQQKQQMTAMTPSQPAQGTRSSIKPGAVLFTSIPEQIPSDHIHPLPDETNQIRRGGNGQIFRGMIGGKSVVYKKTNYRSREFAIIVKLKHKNIIKLLAFMYGEENPAHKRRHFCYHIMPQMSGDCARMLTDKRELTIKELHKKHRDNTRKMGIIRGNLKYLLKEILLGIRYLHSLRITHRDIKGSNILLKFFCSCTNPLECGCDSKCQVQICDFDAAIELDENEQLPLTQVGSKTSSSRPSYNHYVTVPVGTNGFRSPECSMLAISNVTDVFYPPITTRSDIWSLGILTLRILIGATGPSSQREMALLLLHYYHQRYMHEGLHKRPDCFNVDRLVTDKLLSMPTLVQEVGWLKGAVRFIECCVAVDPFARYSAEALLQHDFLY